jgi:hypothetical protein
MKHKGQRIRALENWRNNMEVRLRNHIEQMVHEAVKNIPDPFMLHAGKAQPAFSEPKSEGYIQTDQALTAEEVEHLAAWHQFVVTFHGGDYIRAAEWVQQMSRSTGWHDHSPASPCHPGCPGD